RHFDALQTAALHVQVGDRLAAPLALVPEAESGAHLLEGRIEAGTQWIDADILDHDVAARADTGGHHGECGRRRIARHDDVAGLELRPADDGDALARSAFDRSDANLGAEVAQ